MANIFGPLERAASEDPELEKKLPAVFKKAIDKVRSLGGNVERDVTPKAIEGSIEKPPAIETPSIASESPIKNEEISSQQTDYSKSMPGDISPEGKKSTTGRNLLRAAAGAAAAGGLGYSMFGGGDKPPKDNSVLPTIPESSPAEAPAPANVPGDTVRQIEHKPNTQIDASLKARQEAALSKLNMPATAPKAPASKEEEDTEEEEKPQYLNFGTQEQNKNELADVQKRQNMAELTNALGKSAERVGAGINMTAPVGQEGFDANIKAAQNVTKQYLDRKAQEDSDPTSGSSQAARDYIKKFGVNVSDGASAAQLKQVMPYVFKDFEAKQAAEAKSADLQDKIEQRAHDAEQNRQKDMRIAEMKSDDRRFQAEQGAANRALSRREMDLRHKEATAQRQDQQDENKLFKANKEMSEDMANSRTAFGKAATNLQSIKNAKALLNGEIDPNNLDNRQLFELVRVADRVLSNGNPTQFGAEHLTPDTAMSRWTKMKEYWDNQRHGAQAGSFVKSISSTLDREEKQANDQIYKTKKEYSGVLKGIHDRHPEAVQDLLESKGLPRDLFAKEKGRVYNTKYGNQAPPQFDPSAAAAELSKRMKKSTGDQ